MATIDPGNLANLRSMRYGDQSAELAQIQSARNALRLLDGEITRTELRLRALPKLVPTGTSGGSGSTGSTGSHIASRHAPKKMGLNRQMIPIKMGASGLGLNPAAMNFGGKGATVALGFHIVAGVGNQLMDTGKQMSAVRKAGGSQSEQAMVPLLGVGRAVTDMLGVTAMAKMLMRPGVGEAEASRRVEHTLNRAFTPPSVWAKQQRDRAKAANVAFQGVNDRWKDDVAFIDTWTPDDFDVAGDATRQKLKDELWDKNRIYLDALADIRMREQSKKIQQGGD